MKSDILKLWIFIGASMVLGALLTPWLFAAGQGLVEAESSSPSGFSCLAWLAEKAETHPYADYFKRALSLAAALLLYPTYRWIKRGDKTNRGLGLTANPHKGKDWLVGFILASNLLLSLGFLGISLGYFTYDDPIEVAKSLRQAVLPALGAGVVEELLFRGALLGIFLRSCRSRRMAIVGLSLVFALVHLLQPPPGIQIDEANVGWGTGFWIIGQIALQLMTPAFFVSEVATLFVVGLILADARVRTSSLWLPIGLHMGWVFSHQLFKGLSDRAEVQQEWLLGGSVKEGVAPLLVLALTWVMVRHYLKKGSER